MPALGAKVMARTWVDAGFRARLLANGRPACEELGISFYDAKLFAEAVALGSEVIWLHCYGERFTDRRPPRAVAAR